ncbi:MAG: YqhV family protein [Firmicutes bacterium]|nr:YqhV family protein [Bacillota bacterium]
MLGLEPYVGAMVLVRLISAGLELTGATLMARFNRVDAALRVNALLGLTGPLVLLTVTTIGVLGLAGEMPAWRIGLVFLGVALILFAVRS